MNHKMRIIYSPDIKDAMKAGTVTREELYADFCREHHGDYGEVSEADIKYNEECIRNRYDEARSIYPAVNGERRIQFCHGFDGAEDVGVFCYVGEL